ncbi:MAG TPA: VOC family protein [Burkholderiales bacterium]|nr:VOC family protein [Burkholderiales bacterium]
MRITGIDHVVLRVRDLKAMERFYCDVLGAQYLAHRPKFHMTHLRVGSSLIDLVVGEAGGKNMDHLCLRVEPFDQDVIVKHLRAHGVEVGDIKNRFGAEGNGVSIYLTDPEGNMVELKGPSDGKAPPD